jgi:hypothetical protein
MAGKQTFTDLQYSSFYAMSSLIAHGIYFQPG